MVEFILISSLFGGDAHQFIRVSKTPDLVLLVQFTSVATLRMA
jgi:hypothetical protein